MEIHRGPFVGEAPDGTTGYYTLCAAACGFHGASRRDPPPFQTQHPKRDPCPFQTLRPEAHWRAWIDASSDRAPPKRCALRRDPCPPLQTLRPQTRPFPKCRPRPDAARAPFQTLSTLPQMLSMPLSKHRMCPPCVIGFQKCVGFIGDPAACASFSSSLSGVLRSRSALYITPVR